jgi:hypothetical protein
MVLAVMAMGCDCMRHVQCRVVDNATGMPLADVKVIGHFISNEETRTDSTGTFQLSGIVGHLTCPRVKATLSAPGYRTREKRLRSGELLRLERDVPHQ